VEGAFRFLQRLWRAALTVAEKGGGGEAKDDGDLRQKTHATIKKVSDDIGGERFQFNTAIAAVMELVNAVYAHSSYKGAANTAVREAVEAALRVLHPMAPHLTEEAWAKLGHATMLASSPWPTYDASIAQKKRVIYAVQVMGKLRGQVETEPEADQNTIEPLARALDSARAYLDGKQTVKVVFVPGRLNNFVVR
jgi:leucyl-tRNA synthetase